MSDPEERTDSNKPTASVHYRGPGGLGESAARALGSSIASGESVGGLAEELFLKQWFTGQGHLFVEGEWLGYHLISNHTAEHEVRYRDADHRAVKKTWPGTYGNVPRLIDSLWVLRPATPLEYFTRLALQNEIFGDTIQIEGAIISSGPSMIIGQPADGLSIISSQPWLDAADDKKPHPSEPQVDEFMKSLGFTCLISSLYGWQNSDSTLIVLDAKPDNFILTSAGILPIDLLLTETET